jgi:4-hydroxy-3-methylbut-2-en-1-yl diphosphate synthase IspG/GcpE
MGESSDGVGWFDQAVIFCPFCGRRLQDKEDIARKVREAAGGVQ